MQVNNEEIGSILLETINTITYDINLKSQQILDYEEEIKYKKTLLEELKKQIIILGLSTDFKKVFEKL